MKSNSKTTRELLAENAELRARLAEAEEVIEAIGTGAVDAVVVSGPQGDQVFTLKGAEHAYRVLVEAMSEGAATLSRDGDILYANTALAQMLRKPLEKIIGTPLRGYVAPEDVALFDAMLLQGGQTSARGELTLTANDAARLPAFMSISNLELEEAQALCIVATDLTEQKRNEEMVAAERLARSIIEQAGEAILVCDTQGMIIRANFMAQQLAAANPLFQSFDSLFLLEEEKDSNAFTIIPTLTGEIIQGLEVKFNRGDGQVFHLLLNAGPMVSRELKIIGAVVTLTNITRRKQAEETLRESEERYRTLVETTGTGYLILDSQGKVIDANKEYVRLSGHVSLEEILGRSVVEWTAAHDHERNAAEVVKCLQQGYVRGLEVDYVDHQGRITPIEINATVLPLEDSFQIVSLCRDISERKQAVEMFLKEKKLSDIIIDSLPGIFYFFEVGRFLRWNANFEKVSGYTAAEFAQLNPLDLFVGEGKNLMAQAMQEVFLRGENTAEAELVTKSGSKIHYFFTGKRFDLDGTPFLLGMGIDISDRKRAEKEVLAAAHKWRTTFDSIGDAVSLLDRDHNILQCNQAMADLVGKPFSEIVGRKCWELVHGATAPIEGCPILRMCASRRRETLTLPMGDRWLHVMVDPVLSEAGEVTGGVHIIADITRHKLAEEKIRNLNSLLQAIKDINEALLWVKSEPELFRQICDLTIHIPYVRFAWIGLVAPESFAVKPVAWAGAEEGYLAAVKVTWDDTPYGRGPTGTAIKTGQPAVVDDVETDPGYGPWREEARQRGYASAIALPLAHDGTTLGILNVYAGKKYAFGEEEISYLQQVAGDIALGLRSLRLAQELELSLKQTQAVFQQTVEALAAMSEMRDPYTAGHQRGVTHLALALAAEMGLVEDRREGLRKAGFLHDIGKIVVPAEILNKPGKISEFEMQMIRVHPRAGYDILSKIDFPWPVARIVLQHHERLDGSGYPQGLTGPDILLEARILAVADVVEAMSSHRPYRPALGVEQALEEITRHKGVLYDAEIVDICMKLFTEKGFQL